MRCGKIPKLTFYKVHAQWKKKKETLTRGEMERDRSRFRSKFQVQPGRERIISPPPFFPVVPLSLGRARWIIRGQVNKRRPLIVEPLILNYSITREFGSFLCDANFYVLAFLYSLFFFYFLRINHSYGFHTYFERMCMKEGINEVETVLFID